MKKSLIALAALAAVSAASAQSTVTISGLLDMGVRSVNAPGVDKDTKGVIASGGSATTAILIQGSEDLGGGLKANFRYEINPDLGTGGGMTGVGQSVIDSKTIDTSHTGAQGYHFVGLSGGFGEVKAGRLNTGTLAAWGTASVFGTALGSGYSSSGQYVRYGATATTAWNTAPTRFNNAVEYTTPKVAGFTGRILYAPKVDQAGGKETTTSAVTAAGVNRAGATDLSLAYSVGPLNVNLAQQKITVGSNDINNTLVGVGPTVAAGDSSKLTTLAASYTIGAVKVSGGYWTEKQSTVDIKGYILGAKYTMGAIDLMASMAKTDDKVVANVDRKIMGVGADYNLSKRSALWARYENRDANSNSGADTSAAGSTKTMAAGIRHNF